MTKSLLATLRGLCTAVPQKPSALSSQNFQPSSRKPPIGEGWIHEIKYDGYRTLIVIDRGQVRAFTRNGNDWTRVSMLAASWPAITAVASRFA